MTAKPILNLLAALLLAVGAACSSPEERAQSYIQSGLSLLAEDKPELAGIEFKNALKINDKLVVAWYGLAQVEERQGRWDKVFPLLNKVVDLEPTHLDAQVKLGKLLLLAGQLDKALDISTKAMRLDSANSTVRTLRAAVLYKLDDTKGAVEFAASALEADPTNVDAITVLVAERLAAKDMRAAIDYLDHGIKNNEKNIALHLIKIQALEAVEKSAEAEAVFRRLVSLYPQRPEFRKGLARYLLKHKRLDDAEKEARALAADYPDDPEVRLDVVRLINATKGIEAALAELTALIREQPGIYRYQFALAQVLLSQQRAEEARKVLERIAQKAEDKENSLAAKAEIAEILLQEKKPDEALTIVEEVLAEDKRHLKALLLRASLRIDKRELDDAIGDVRSILKDSPQSTKALVLLARAYQLNGAIELAEDTLASAFRVSASDTAVGLHYVRFLMRYSRPERAEDVLATMLAREPRNVEVLRAMAQVRLSLKNWQGAQEVAETLRRLGSDEVAADDILGRALEGQNKFDKSIEFFRLAHDASPLALRPMVSLVRAYIRSGRREDAKSFLRAVLDANDKNIQALVLLARVHLLEENGAQAAEPLFKQALERDPGNVLAYRELAQFYGSQERFDDAEAVLSEGLARHPRDLSLQLVLAGLFERRGKIDEAIKQYGEMHKDRPDSDVFANNLASLLSEYRDDKDSIQRAYDLAKRFRDSSVPYFKDTLGWIHYRLGEADRAKPLLEAAVVSQPNLPIFRYHLGMTLLARQDTEAAQKELRRALELSKDAPFAHSDKVKQALDQLAAEGMQAGGKQK